MDLPPKPVRDDMRSRHAGIVLEGRICVLFRRAGGGFAVTMELRDPQGLTLVTWEESGVMDGVEIYLHGLTCYLHPQIEQLHES